MQWDDLRVFLALAQAGSLRRASRVLKLGQPTVVRHMRRLEETVGTRLFERTKDGHRLTQAGQELLPLAQGMADSATAIDRRRAACPTATAASSAWRAGSGARAFSRRAWPGWWRRSPS